jgi:hypothetical protein
MRTSPEIRGAAGPCIQHRRPERYRQVDGVPIRRFSASRAASRGEAAQSPTPASSSGPGRAAGAIAAPRTIAGANWSRSRLAEVKSSALPERERPLSGPSPAPGAQSQPAHDPDANTGPKPAVSQGGFLKPDELLAKGTAAPGHPPERVRPPAADWLRRADVPPRTLIKSEVRFRTTWAK